MCSTVKSFLKMTSIRSSVLSFRPRGKLRLESGNAPLGELHLDLCTASLKDRGLFVDVGVPPQDQGLMVDVGVPPQDQGLMVDVGVPPQDQGLMVDVWVPPQDQRLRVDGGTKLAPPDGWGQLLPDGWGQLPQSL